MAEAPTATGRGRFITFEGAEAAGKTTQVRLLASRLRAAGQTVATTREPGGTPGAEKLRSLLLSGDVAWSPLAETLLHFAARADHVSALIVPALRAGQWVLCDRFADSTMAYQGFGQGADRKQIDGLTGMLGIVPDLTFVLDVPPDVSRLRLAGRGGGLDRYERLDDAFFARVREGFATIAAGAPHRCVVVPAVDSPDLVAAAIWQAMLARLGPL